MKLTRKILAIALCILMLAALCAPAMAAETGDESPKQHTYEAYQVFSGTEAGGDVLTNITWGSGVNGAGFVAALQSNAIFGAGENNLFYGITVPTLDKYERDMSARQVAAVIAEQGWEFDSKEAQALARAAYANKNGTAVSLEEGYELAHGYYLVVDITELDEVGDYRNIALLQVTKEGKVNISEKVSAPTVEKKVQDDDNADAEGNYPYQDSADYDIGDDVPFKITAELGKIDHFKEYKVIFHDTLSAGLTYNEGSVKITLTNPDGESADVTDKFDITNNGTALTFGCDDILALGAENKCKIVITYTAKLNEGAVIGEEGNPNTVYLEYSHDPNLTEEGKINPSTGKTPEDKVVVYTYQVVLTKVDKENNPLTGAEFELYKKVGADYVKVEGEDVVSVSEDGTVFTFKGLDAGEYKLVETKAPAGYNKIDPIEFEIIATHSVEADDPQLLTLECNVTMWDGDLGLDFDEKGLSVEKSTGTVSGNIVNVAGLVLPGTGGTGTTIFYAVGSLIVLCAVVGLVAKKRMEGIA